MEKQKKAKIIGSCGHELKNVSGNFISYQEFEGDKGTTYSTVCDECLVWYQKEMSAKMVEAAESD